MSRYLLRATKMIGMRIGFKWATWYTRIKFSAFQVQYGSGLTSRGIPLLDLSLKASFTIGEFLHLNNGHYYNTIGRQQNCCFIVGSKGRLKIGNHVGISGTTIVCKNKIDIEDFVLIGGNCEIYDTDFHDLDYRKRMKIPEDYETVKTRPIRIGSHAFIGAHSTILKGVTIGEGAIIGACSVVTKNIPPFEIWAGNPVRFISKAPKYSGSDTHSTFTTAGKLGKGEGIH